MEGFSNFFQKFGGALIGGIVALILACTSFYRFVIGLALVIMGMWAGNYIQKNKEEVKEKLKNFIDRM